MEVGRHGGMVANEHIAVGEMKKVKTFKYLDSLLTVIHPFRVLSGLSQLPWHKWMK